MLFEALSPVVIEEGAAAALSPRLNEVGTFPMVDNRLRTVAALMPGLMDDGVKMVGKLVIGCCGVGVV